MSSSNKPTSSKIQRKNKNKHKADNEETQAQNLNEHDHASTVDLLESKTKLNENSETDSVIQLLSTMEQYKNIIKLAGDKILLVEFFADWCGPCRILNPKLEELAKAYSDHIIIIKVDIDELEDLAREFNVTVIPTIVVMKNEKKLEQLSGLNKDQIEKLILTLVREEPPANEEEDDKTTTTRHVDIPVEIPVVEPIKIPSMTRTSVNKENISNAESSSGLKTDPTNSEK